MSEVREGVERTDSQAVHATDQRGDVVDLPQPGSLFAYTLAHRRQDRERCAICGTNARRWGDIRCPRCADEGRHVTDQQRDEYVRRYLRGKDE